MAVTVMVVMTAAMVMPMVCAMRSATLVMMSSVHG
jgi:hypothetical protein